MLLAAFLGWRYRSVLLLGLVAVPLAAGTIAGFAATALLSGGAVHGIALGFGMTMLGVAVDYPILLVTLRRDDETLSEAAARIWPTLRLAAGAAASGLAAMLGSGFPGLVQLGVFAGVGLLTAAATTRWVLPWLVPAARITARPLPAPLRAALGALRGRRRLAGAVVLAATAGLAAAGGPGWQRDLAALSPVPRAAQELDAALRRHWARRMCGSCSPLAQAPRRRCCGPPNAGRDPGPADRPGRRAAGARPAQSLPAQPGD